MSFTVSSTAQKKKDDHVLVCEENVPVPEGAKYIGKIAIHNRLIPQTSEEMVIKTAVQRVIEKNANILKIREIRMRNTFNSDYSLWGEAYYVDDIDKAIASMPAIPDTVTPYLIKDTAQYALLFVFRPIAIKGATIDYQLHLNDREIFNATKGSYDTIKVYKEGLVNLWAATDIRSEAQLDIHFGKVYFIKCEIDYGYVAPCPRITVMKNTFRGYTDYKQAIADINTTRPKQYEDY
jgi:hypothetical protein